AAEAVAHRDVRIGCDAAGRREADAHVRGAALVDEIDRLVRLERDRDRGPGRRGDDDDSSQQRGETCRERVGAHDHPPPPCDWTAATFPRSGSIVKVSKKLRGRSENFVQSPNYAPRYVSTASTRRWCWSSSVRLSFANTLRTCFSTALWEMSRRSTIDAF